MAFNFTLVDVFIILSNTIAFFSFLRISIAMVLQLHKKDS